MYTTVKGDTFESVSRKRYGSEAEAGRIASANPGIAAPLSAGTALVIPAVPGAPTNIPSSVPASTVDEVSIVISGNRFRFWSGVQITRSLDSISAVDFSAPFDHTAPGFKDSFRPFEYKPVAITVGGSPVFTGTMVNPIPVLGGSKAISVSAYSTPGVLDDCTAPASAYPLEFNDRGLKSIARAMAAPFGISIEFDGDQGAPFERVACEPEKKVLPFLMELAQLRGLVISDTPAGALRFQKSVQPGKPVARLRQGETPLLSVTPAFSPQEYYSHITGIESAFVGIPGAQYTVRNKRMQGIIRPYVFSISDTTQGSVKATVQAKAGRMVGNMAAYIVALDTWRDPAGALWKPNTTLTLYAPDAMVYKEYEFIIRSVQLERSSGKVTASLNLVLPGAFSGAVPEVLPWD